MSRRINGEGSWGVKDIGGHTYQRFSATIDGIRKDFYGRTKTEAREKYEDYLLSHGKSKKKSSLTLVSAAYEMLDFKKTRIKQTTYGAYLGEIKFLEKQILSISVNKI